MPRPVTLRALALLVVALASAGAHAPGEPALREMHSAASLAPAARRAAESARRAARTAVSSEAVFEALSWSPGEARRELATRAAGTYIGEMLSTQDSSIARWPNRRDRPLRVWVQRAAHLPTWEPGHVQQVRGAFGEWAAVGIPVPFSFGADSASADVHVTWVEQFAEQISGKTVWARNESWWIVDGDITIALRHSGGEPLDGAAIRAIALHEVGHLLGLDHTADPANIMAPRVRVRDLSASDRATMRLLYELPAGRIR
jgi:hypothetical protein